MAISKAWRRSLAQNRINIVSEGILEIPAQVAELSVSMDACVTAGAEILTVPRIVRARAGNQIIELCGGDDVYAIFDSVVSCNGKEGRLAFIFTDWSAGQVHENPTSGGIFLFREGE